MLALHLTSPTSSEAKVLAAIFEHLDPDIEAHLWINERTNELPRSDFASLANVVITPKDVALPIDPWRAQARTKRVYDRLMHNVRRLQLLRDAWRLRPDVVYTSQQRFDCVTGQLISWLLGVPQIIHLHFTPGPVLRPMVQRRLRTCDLVIAVSQFIGERASSAGVDPGRIVVIPNTLPDNDAPWTARSPRDEVVIGQTGRLEEEKGFRDSVRALARVRATQPRVTMTLIGDGSDRVEVERLAKDVGVADAVRFTGWRDDVPGLLHDLDVFIHPSRNEPFGLSVLEASGAGLPIVAYADGGIPEIVIDGVTGFLVPVGDIEALAAAVCRLVVDPDLRNQFGEAGQRRVREVFTASDAGRLLSRSVVRLVRPGSHDDAR